MDRAEFDRIFKGLQDDCIAIAEKYMISTEPEAAKKYWESFCAKFSPKRGDTVRVNGRMHKVQEVTHNVTIAGGQVLDQRSMRLSADEITINIEVVK